MQAREEGEAHYVVESPGARVVDANTKPQSDIRQTANPRSHATKQTATREVLCQIAITVANRVMNKERLTWYRTLGPEWWSLNRCCALKHEHTA